MVGLEPAVNVLEEGAAEGGPSRLDVPDSSSNSGWTVLTGEGAEAQEQVFACEFRLCGEAAPVVLTVGELRAADGSVAVPALQQPITIAPGAADNSAVRR
jgi:hypothetical protein